MILKVLSPEKEILSVEDAVSVELPGTQGRFVVLKGHAPLVTSLEKGIVRYRSGGKLSDLEIDGGFAEVLNDTITVCAA